MAEKVLREGYTTGSTATAAMKAALLALQDDYPAQVVILSPQKKEIRVPIEGAQVISEHIAEATALKDGGEDMDVTHGTPIRVRVELTDSPGLQYVAGEGVGTVTKPGLQVKVGEPAINPGPRLMMKQVYDELVPSNRGCIVTITVPEGKRLAEKTLNPVLGVVGGISIIGTSGIVKPMSEEAYKNSLVPQLTVLAAQHCHKCVFTPGRIGQDTAKKVFGFRDEDLVETSNFLGFMLEQAVDKGMQEILMVGHIGKLIKIASGSFHTHNRMSDGRMETLAVYAAMNGATAEVVKEIMACATTDAGMEIIEREQLEAVYEQIAERAQVRAIRYIHKEAQVGVILVTMQGKVLAMSSLAKEWGRRDGWLVN